MIIVSRRVNSMYRLCVTKYPHHSLEIIGKTSIGDLSSSEALVRWTSAHTRAVVTMLTPPIAIEATDAHERFRFKSTEEAQGRLGSTW